MSQEMEALTKECSTCGAVFPISPEDLVVTCKYCGETYDVEGKKIPDHQMIRSKDEQTIRENITTFLKKNGAAQGVIEELRPRMIPFWVVPFDSDTHYYGVQNGTVTRQKTETYKDSEGNTRTRTVTYTVNVYRPKEGDFHRSGRENVIARKHTAFYGFNRFQETLFLDNIEPFDFNVAKENDAEFINAEVDAEEARRIAHGRVEDENRQIAASKVDRLVRCDSTIRTSQPIYVHAPLWTARYKFQGKVYKISASGDSGKVVKGEIPLTLAKRVMFFIIGMVIASVGVLLGQLVGVPAILASEDFGYIVVVVGAVLIVGSFFVTKVAFQMQLEKSQKIKRPKRRKKGN